MKWDAEDVESMLSDDEALDGIEAWLERQQLTVDVGSRHAELAARIHIETPAGWLLRLVRHARCARAARRQ